MSVTPHNDTLYTVKWDSSKYYDNKKHTISIESCYEGNMCSIDSRPFILNRSPNNNFHWGQTLMKLLCTSVSYP